MGFVRSDVEALSSALSEPDWVLERRLESWGWFEKMELPGEKEEPWRYTNLARLKFKLDEFTAVPGTAAVGSVEAATGRCGLLLERGAFRELGRHPLHHETRVIFTDIHTAIAEHPDLVRPHLFAHMDTQSHIFSALHAALFSGGAFLYVPRGVSVDLPIETRHMIDQDGVAIFPHTLIVVEEGAEVCYIERFSSSGLTGSALSNAGIEVAAGQASRVFVTSIQEYQMPVWHIELQRFATERDANFKSLVVTLGGRFSRTETEAAIGGEGNSVNLMGLYLPGSGQHFDFRTLQDHRAPHSTSDLLYKGALRANARSVYSGLIHVRPEGNETDAYQTNRNLILSDDALADSKPELEIENNDVRCSHAASVGQIDENEIFYLQSRGIERSAAERLVVHGFFEEVLGRIGRTDIHYLVQDLLESRLS
ncbi:MAG: Fe-S cluster assembly protein SufD [Actinomycetota bacterium]